MIDLYIDSAVRSDIDRLLATGLFAGVTSNPAILDKAGLSSADIPDFVKWSVDAGARRVFVQSWGTTADELVERGESFRSLDRAVVVKVTASREGVQAARRLATGGEVLVTAAFSAAQVVPVIAAGATFIAPFVGQMTAAGRDGLAETLAMQRATESTGSATRVLAGSLRTPAQMLELAIGGVRHMTLSPPVWDSSFEDELTAAAVDKFHSLATA